MQKLAQKVDCPLVGKALIALMAVTEVIVYGYLLG